MPLLIPRITPQEGFPHYEDLTPGNVSWLAVALSDPRFLRESHDTAEAGSFLYRESHPALRAAATRLPGEDIATIARVVSHGAAVLEAACSIAGPASRPAYNRQYVVLNARHLSGAEGDGLVVALQDAEKALRTNRPRLWEVVNEVARMHYPNVGHYAMFGAGMMHELQMAALDDS